MPQSGVPSWSQTAATNATIDPTVNFAEGQAPSSVNDSARALMAGVAKYRDDTAGALITGGSPTAYTLTSNTGFFSKATMDRAEISFTVSATNGASPTLNVDGLGADPITLDGTTPVPTGTLIAGSIYTAMYYFSGAAWRLKDFYQVPFIVPIGAMIDFTGSTAPSSNFVFPYGQAISRATYSAYFAMVSTTYGAGDGTTTFNIPDLRGRVVAGKDDMGGSAASRLSGASITTGGATTLGGSGGSETKTLITNNLPPYTPSGSVAVTSNSGSQVGFLNIVTTGPSQYGGTGTGASLTQPIINGTFTGAAQGGTSTPFAIVAPTIIMNKLLRII
jgi:microcystin-dependent protein